MTEYTDMLYDYAVKTNAKTIMELGVGEGHSTVALLRAAIRNGGHLYSVDIKYQPVACNRIKESGLDEGCWTYILCDDLELEWKLPVDLLFIDSSHYRVHTLKELIKYSPYVRGIILMHDILIKDNPEGWDVTGGIFDFLRIRRGWLFSRLPVEGDEGLGLLWKE